MTVFWGLITPFIGTTLGAACVFFIKGELKPLIQKGLLGFCGKHLVHMGQEFSNKVNGICQ